ncbi:MAG: DUF1830 domain-containing protein [Xenococcaceae cyanobacterium]
MTQILDPIPSGHKNSILCCYVNATSQIQVARITNVSNWYFERVVFPGQRLVFETLPEALLEIHTGMMASAILSDTIPCERLCVKESGNSQMNAAPLPVSATTDNRKNIEATDNKTKESVAPLKTALVAAI